MNEPVAGSKLIPKALRELRAKAHALKPVVWVSQNGMSEGALREIDRALNAHELVKVHADLDDRRARAELLAAICGTLGAEPVQVVGKMLVAFRPRTQPEPQAAPRPAGTRAGDRGARPIGRAQASAVAPTRARTHKRPAAKPKR